MHIVYKKKLQRNVVNIYPGEYYVTNENIVISTVLGSCISVFLYDEINNISGMNHFMLPQGTSHNFSTADHQFRPEKLNDDSLRYGITSMEILIRELQALGAERKYFKAKIFGGGHVLGFGEKHEGVGKQNIEFIITFLKTEEINIIQSDVGLKFGRKVLAFTGDKKVYVKKIKIKRILHKEEKVKDIAFKTDVTLF